MQYEMLRGYLYNLVSCTRNCCSASANFSSRTGILQDEWLRLEDSFYFVCVFSVRNGFGNNLYVILSCVYL